MTDIKHDANWMHSNGLDSKDIGNIRGAKAVVEGMNPLPFTDRDANFLYELVGKLALILDAKEEPTELEKLAINYIVAREEFYNSRQKDFPAELEHIYEMDMFRHLVNLANHVKFERPEFKKAIGQD